MGLDSFGITPIAPTTVRAFDPRDQVETYRSEEGWGRIVRCIAPSIRRDWATIRRVCRFRLHTLAEHAFRSYLAWWLYEPAPMEPNGIDRLVRESTNIVLPTDVTPEVLAKMIQFRQVRRSRNGRDRSMPPFWTWTGGDL